MAIIKKRYRILSAVIVIVMSVAFPAFAQETKKLHMTLKEAIGISLKGNLSISVDAVTVSATRADLQAKRGEFDNVVKLKMYEANTKDSAMAGILMPEQRTSGQEIGIGGKLKYGTQYELKYSTVKTKNGVSFFTSSTPYYSSGLTLNVIQPVLKGWGRDVQETAIKVAENTSDASTLRLRSKMEDVVFQTVSAYWSLVSARKNYNVAETSLHLAKNLQTETQAKIDAGIIAPVEIFKSDAEVAFREESLLRSLKAVIDAEDNLKIVLNMTSYDTEIIPTDDFPGAATSLGFDDFGKLLDDSLAKRADYIVAKIDRTNAVVMKNFYENQIKPDLDLSASAGLNGLEGSYSDSVDKMAGGTWQVAVTMTIPLGNNGAKGNFLKAKLDEERSDINLDALKQKIAFELREAIRAVKLAEGSVNASNSSVTAANKRLRSDEERYRLGMSTLNDVFKAEEQYSVAVTSYVRSMADYAIAVVKVQKARGALLDFYKIPY